MGQGIDNQGKESLEIYGFGPVKNVRIEDLKRFNVFVGESGSGKSTIMKVMAMMRWIYKMMCIRSYLKDSGISNTPFRLRLDAILKKNGLWPLFSNDSRIIYTNGKFQILISQGKINFPQKSVDTDELTIQKIAYISDKRVLVPDLMAGNVSLRHNMFYLDETLLNFQKATDIIASTKMNYVGVEMKVKKINGIKRVFVSDNDNAETFANLPLTNASSGIQSSVALHFIMLYFARHYNIVEALNSTILKYLAENDNLSKFKPTEDIGGFPRKRVSIHLEEPELSLFPTNQWGLMRYLIHTCMVSEGTDMDLTLATHSPYILTALNIMMMAYRANEKGSDIDDESLPLLDPSDLGAWEVIDGQVNNIYSEELHMIDGTYLDSASDIYEEILTRLNDRIYG